MSLTIDDCVASVAKDIDAADVEPPIVLVAHSSGGLIVLNGIGAAGTPILVGYLMKNFGPSAFLIFIAVIMAAIALGVAIITVFALFEKKRSEMHALFEQVRDWAE